MEPVPPPQCRERFSQYTRAAVDPFKKREKMVAGPIARWDTGRQKEELTASGDTSPRMANDSVIHTGICSSSGSCVRTHIGYRLFSFRTCVLISPKSAVSFAVASAAPYFPRFASS